MSTNGGAWESARKDAWLWELLSSSSEDEGGVEDKRAKTEDKYSRFGESSRWMAEASSLEARSWVEVKAEEMGEQGRGHQQLHLDKMLGTLDLLDERAEKIDIRLKQIETQMGELRKEEEGERAGLGNGGLPKGRVRPNQTSGGGSMCTGEGDTHASKDKHFSVTVVLCTVCH